MQNLRARTNVDAHLGRQDMADIAEYVDIRSTLTLVRNQKQDADDHDALPCDDLCRPCFLDQKDRRQLYTILAGSIRTPSRLAHTVADETGLCQHPACAMAKNGAKHIFWDCAKWSGIRCPYVEAIEKQVLRIPP